MRTQLGPDGLGARGIRLRPEEALELVDEYCTRLRRQIDAGAGAEVSASYGAAMLRRKGLLEMVAS